MQLQSYCGEQLGECACEINVRFTSVILLTKTNVLSCFIVDGNELKNGDNIPHGMTLHHTIHRAGFPYLFCIVPFSMVRNT